MRILLTGFNRFGELGVNPSEVIVQKISEGAESGSQEDIVTDVLQTEFASAGARIRKLIRQVRPEAVVCLGVAPGRNAMSLERVALNLDDTDAPDNAGDTASARIIVPKGPTAYWSTLPIGAMSKALQRRGIPVTISNHAGTYVCNHVFYVARHEIERLRSGAKCGLIHVPLMSEQAETLRDAAPTLPLSKMVAAIQCCFEVLRKRGTEKFGNMILRSYPTRKIPNRLP